MITTTRCSWMSDRGKDPIDWLLDMGGTTTLDSYGPGRDLDLIPEEHHEFTAPS